MNADLPPRVIDLALEPAFELGGMEVRPATLEVLWEGGHEHLEPRVMQVLVALARRRDAVVSRHELNETCWGGRVVGDDAMNRCIFIIRKLAAAHGEFQVATVPRVGFRLMQASPPAGQRRHLRMTIAALAVVVMVALAVFAVQRSWPPGAAAEPRVAVGRFEALAGDPASAAFGVRLADQVEDVLSQNIAGIAVSQSAEGELGRADLIIRGAVSHDGGVWRVRASLEEAGARTLLWSEEFKAGQAGEAALADVVATAVTETLYTALDSQLQKGLKLDPRTLALYIKGSQLQKQPDPLQQDGAERAFEEIVARAPRFAAARAVLALNLQGRSTGSPAGERTGLRRRARAEALRAIGIDASAAGPAYDALFFLERLEVPEDIAKAEGWLKQGMRKAPTNAFVFMRECVLLLDVGRSAEGLTYCQQASALRPMAAPVAHNLARALQEAGRVELAQVAIANAARRHPNSLQMRWTRLEMAAFSGSIDEARELLHDPGTAPQTLTADGAAAFDALLQARRSGAQADIDDAIARFRAAAVAGRLAGSYVVIAAVALGRVDEAFRAAAEWPPAVAESGPRPSYLMRASMAPLRRDPRFWPIAAKAGLVTYWRIRNILPEFCSDPTLPYDCRQEMAKLG